MFSYFKKHSVVMGFVIVLVLLVASGIIFNSNKTKTTEQESSERTVKVIPVSDFSSDTQKIQTMGSVESLEQAEIRSQFSAPVTKISVAIGDTVKRGQTLVVLQNSDISAQLEQALAGVRAQEARLEELKKGARAEDLKVSSNDITQAEEAYKNTLTNALTTINNALVSSEDAVKNQAELLFIENSDKINFSTSDLQSQIDAESSRISAKNELVKWRTEYLALSASSDEKAILAVITNSKTHGTVIKSYLSHLYDALSGAHITPQFTQTALTGYKTSINGARNSVNGAITALTGVEQGIVASKIALSRANDIFALKKVGASDEQINSQTAALDQARAAADGLRATLSKTIIQAPIDGKISALPVRLGELVSGGQSVVSIINTKGLQVKAYISEDDYKRIEYGSRVLIESNIDGSLMKVAPGLDKQTKKIEIKVLVTSEGGLIVGQDVKLSIPVKKESAQTTTYHLPIQNVKIVPGNAYVYTVNSSSKIEAHQVILGEVRGDFIEVKEGIKPDMKIVSPVYDLKEGDSVRVE